MSNSNDNRVYTRLQARMLLRQQQHLLLALFLVSIMFVVLSVSSTGTAAATGVGDPHLHLHLHHPPPERGKFLQYPFEAEQCYRVYKELQQDYQDKAFHNDDGNDENENKNKNKSDHHFWKTLVDRDGVQVAMLPRMSDPTCPYVRMQAVIPVSVERCWDFLSVSNWDRTMPKMDPFYEGVSVHGEFEFENVHMILCRKRTKRFLAFGKRDLTFLSVKDEPLEDGTWVSGSVSVVTNKVPRAKGYCRAFQDSIAFYKPLKNNTETAVTIICRIDLNDSAADGEGGHIPMWLYVKTIGITGAKSILNMKRALMQEQEDRNADKIQEQLIMEDSSSSIMNMKRALMQEQEDRNADKIQEQPVTEDSSSA